MVVILTLASIVELSVFFLIILLLLYDGSLALLYHLRCTHYALRGGLSSNGIYCGTFFIFVYVSTGAADWTIGAALS